MKTLLFTSLIFLTYLDSSLAEPLYIKKTETSIQIVKRVFRNYIRFDESTDSPENKAVMEKALRELQITYRSNDLSLLLDVWMYYDPTDFPTRDLINPILHKNKSISLNAVNKRIQKKKKWESVNTAPFSELLSLHDELSK